jgi:hypothetical protein
MQELSLETHACSSGTTHLAQLFDSDESLAEAVADFFEPGLKGREMMLAVMDGARWNAVAMRLSARGLPVNDALRFGCLTVRNARETLTKFTIRERPHPGLFVASVGTLVAGLAAFGKPLRIYGEMVDVLVSRGEYTAACELEALWNELGERHPFTLFCGYSSAHFGDPRNAAALRRICASHGKVLSSPRDVLGSFLLRTHQVG